VRTSKVQRKGDKQIGIGTTSFSGGQLPTAKTLAFPVLGSADDWHSNDANQDGRQMSVE